MGTVQKVLQQKGWLSLAFDDGDFGRKWVILDNGVLWVHRDNGDGPAEQVIPLQDAEVQFPSTSTSTSASADLFDIVILLEAGRRRLRLRSASKEEYRRWTESMLEAGQLWHHRRQMAFQAVLSPSAGGRGRSRCSLTTRCSATTPVLSLPSTVAEGRQSLLQALTHFLEEAGELRTRTRRAVTRTHQSRDAPQDAAGDGADLPRFLRRAIADAVEKIWRACGRARTCAHVAGGLPDPLAVYDGALILREAVDAFVTYCSLLRDLQIMLRDSQSDGLCDDPLPFSPLRCLSMIRDALARLGPLIRTAEEETRQRATLAAVDATLQRCWTELSKRPLDKDLDAAAADASCQTGGQQPAAGDRCARAVASSPASTPPASPCLPFKQSSSRLASRLQRDVVRTSVRRARKRARTEAQALLPDQPLDDSLEVVEMAVLTPAAPPPPSPSPSPSPSPTFSEQLAMTSEVIDEDKPVAMPKFTAPVPHVACAPNSVPARVVGVDVSSRRRCQDPALLRRRRLVCSAVDCDVVRAGDADAEAGDDVLQDPDTDGRQVREKEATSGAGQTTSQDAVDRPERVAPLVKDDLVLLDIPVTPATPNGGGRRALWCETQEVQRSGLLDRLNTSESALQEAKFEVLSSEESYLRSLDMLAHRVGAIEALQDPGVIADFERDAVTKFLDEARACSMRFVSALRALWSADMMMRGLCTVMHRETMPGASLQQYIHIVSLQPKAASVLAKIGSMEAAQMVPLLSLPAQRASRMPLLLAAILRRLDQRTSEAVICRAALDRLNQIVFECNESLRRAEQTERMVELGRMLRVEKSSSKKSSWSERKNSVIIRAKSFFLKSNSRIGSKTSKILTSTSSMLHLSHH